MQYGTDRYGEKHLPILVSILDVETRNCPETPRPLDELWRVVRRGRRNPAGANMLTDQPLLKTLFYLSEATGDGKYAEFARQYMASYMSNLVDEKGLFWWGWHRHYDVFTEEMTGHQGNFHEIHAIHCIAWDRLWAVDEVAVRKEIEAIWQWHVIDKKTGEIDRHSLNKRGCDFSMSSGAFLYAFAFLYHQTGEQIWLDRAKLLADYYWDRRNVETDLFPERPNAGADRFDGSHFVTPTTGLYCHALLKTFELTGVEKFRDYAVAHLKAYGKYGYDKKTKRFWGTLNLDGSPLLGPRLQEDYAKYEPRGLLDLWEPYVAGYQAPIYTAQAYVYAYQLTKDPALLTTAIRFADWIERNLPAKACMEQSWYGPYAIESASAGTYAGKYGRTISFFIHMYITTQQQKYLNLARQVAEEATSKLLHRGIFRGHPAKPYYEAIDGVGFLLYALLTLDQVEKAPQACLDRQAVVVGQKPDITTLPLDNW